MQEIWIQSLCWEDPLEKGKATHSSILAWRIPCGGLGIAKSGHNSTEWFSLLLFLLQSLCRGWSLSPECSNRLFAGSFLPSFLPSGLRLNVPTSLSWLYHLKRPPLSSRSLLLHSQDHSLLNFCYCLIRFACPHKIFPVVFWEPYTVCVCAWKCFLLFSPSVVSDSLRPCQAPLSMGFFRQEYWSGLSFPSPGDFPDPGIKPLSTAWRADSLPLSHLGSMVECVYIQFCILL